jgi:hypothetical protein
MDPGEKPDADRIVSGIRPEQTKPRNGIPLPIARNLANVNCCELPSPNRSMERLEQRIERNASRGGSLGATVRWFGDGRRLHGVERTDGSTRQIG